jgi:hypothetical protein
MRLEKSQITDQERAELTALVAEWAASVARHAEAKGHYERAEVHWRLVRQCQGDPKPIPSDRTPPPGSEPRPI